jgi:thioredoxin reductase
MAYDVIVIGAGPAGLSAALLLGRCCRGVLVLDDNEPRNRASRGLHGYLTQDGVTPQALRELARADVLKYPGVIFREAKVERIRRISSGFEIMTEAGAVERSHLLLLATGRIDPLPDIPGALEFYGRGVYQCPYCDGWEHRGKKLAVIGSGRRAMDLAEELFTWSDEVVICSNGKPAGPKQGEAKLITAKISRLEGTAAGLKSIHFCGRDPIACDAIFFCTECQQRSSLPEQLGCEFDDEASVVCEGHIAKGAKGLYVAGNVRGGVHLAITAAAEGAEAALAMNDELLKRRPR